MGSFLVILGVFGGHFWASWGSFWASWGDLRVLLEGLAALEAILGRVDASGGATPDLGGALGSILGPILDAKREPRRSPKRAKIDLKINVKKDLVLDRS